MTKHTKWKVITGKNGNKALRLGNTLLMPTWNTTDGSVMDGNDIVERIAAALNWTDGISLDEMKGGVLTLQEKLIAMVEQQSDSDDIYYAEDVFPDWLFDLCGGIDKFDIARNLDSAAESS